MKNNETFEKIHQPEDTLFKRQAIYSEDIMHKYYKFPGKYKKTGPNEYPEAINRLSKLDSSYYVEINSEEAIINVEDETTKVDNETYEKIDRYRRTIEYKFEGPVLSGITTTVPIDKCQKQYNPSPTLTLKPLIRSLPEYKDSERLNKIKSKIKNNIVLSKVEAMDVVMTPRMHTENQAEILEEVCQMLRDLKINDEKYKFELILEMQCIIHKYAKTDEDIKRLEKVIGLQKAKNSKEYMENMIISNIRDSGKEEGKIIGKKEGIKEGRFEIALEIKKSEGIEKAMQLTKFTREELEKEKLNR